MIVEYDLRTGGAHFSAYNKLKDDSDFQVQRAYLLACDGASLPEQDRETLLNCVEEQKTNDRQQKREGRTLARASVNLRPAAAEVVRKDVEGAVGSLSYSVSEPADVSSNILSLCASANLSRSAYPPRELEANIISKGKKKYKPVAKKVRPLLATLPDKFRIVRKTVGDPLATLPTIRPNPLPYVPVGRYTEERRNALRAEHTPFLWPAELDMMDDFMCKHQRAFAWEDSKRGSFRRDAFPPVSIPVVEHKPWVLKNIPIPPGLHDEVCAELQRKIKAGVYEPSNSSYRSRWFCVLKKDGKSLRLVHSLEPLNAVTIQHSGVPPIPEHLAEQFAGRPCGATLDLYVGYDEREIDEASRDLTTFQTPFGAHRLVTLPMGWANSVPIFHDDVTHKLW